jgi:hypothetical protein
LAASPADPFLLGCPSDRRLVNIFSFVFQATKQWNNAKKAPNGKKGENRWLCAIAGKLIAWGIDCYRIATITIYGTCIQSEMFFHDFFIFFLFVTHRKIFETFLTSRGTITNLSQIFPIISHTRQCSVARQIFKYKRKQENSSKRRRRRLSLIPLATSKLVN